MKRDGPSAHGEVSRAGRCHAGEKEALRNIPKIGNHLKFVGLGRLPLTTMQPATTTRHAAGSYHALRCPTMFLIPPVVLPACNTPPIQPASQDAPITQDDEATESKAQAARLATEAACRGRRRPASIPIQPARRRPRSIGKPPEKIGAAGWVVG
jgi:hypothetical protein